MVRKCIRPIHCVTINIDRMIPVLPVSCTPKAIHDGTHISTHSLSRDGFKLPSGLVVELNWQDFNSKASKPKMIFISLSAYNA